MNLNQTFLVVLFILTGSASADAPPASLVAEDGTTMVLIPAGPFIMGAGDAKDDEAPPHRRDLPAFYIDATEITVEQYAKFLTATGTAPPSDWAGSVPPEKRDNFPITNITWYDAMRYAIWAGKRLPTEGEWEKAARGTDGRRYPWGNTDDKSRRSVPGPETSPTFHGVGPVGAFPKGASTYGVLDMSGNAWEWTADWYDGYPATAARSIHFGRKYKVIRGGSGLGFYGAPNTGTCTQRGRLVPYGSYDSVGFRCVRDVDPAQAPYDAKQLLDTAEEQLSGSLHEPVKLSYEREFDQYLADGRVPLRIVGKAGQKTNVRFGFPLPKGLAKDDAPLRLLDESGMPIPSATTTLSKWEDGSARWVLLDFHAEHGQRIDVDLRSGSPAAPPAPLTIRETAEGTTVDTGVLRLLVTADGLIREIRRGGRTAIGPMTLEAKIDSEDGLIILHPLPAEKVETEESSPMHGTVRLQGFLARPDNQRVPIKYDLRILAAAGSPRLNLLLTISHHADRTRFSGRIEPYEEPAPTIRVADVSVRFALPESPQRGLVGTDRGRLELADGNGAEVLQPDDLKYVIRRQGLPDETGTRSPGWLAAGRDGDWCMLGVRHFWQNHPKSLFLTSESIGTRLYGGDKLFYWEAGLAKTHEIVLDLAESAPQQVAIDPLRVVMPPAWACGTEAAGAILPLSPESLATFPYWECWRESDMQRWARAMPFGLRDFGDGYMGGPYKGKNAYQNLEYDVSLDFLHQFLRTGQTWYLDAAEPMARHQMDVDVNNFSGLVWKHSPQHTTTEADLGHVFLRGVLLHYLLTGERRSLEMACKAGGWIADEIERGLTVKGNTPGNQVGNERKIGWSLYALTALHEVTGDERYLKPCEALCERLLAGQAPTGKFNIVWDNRISFFNGIAMSGMLTVVERNGDERIAQGVLRVARRTLGFYPEYACRTLNAFCWALEHTNDPRYLDAMARGWESSMEFLHDRTTSTAETHAWKFPRFAARYGLFPMFEGDPPPLPDAATWQAVRFKSPAVEVYLRPHGDKPAPLLIIREGLDAGRAELLDMAGRPIKVLDMTRTDRYFEAAPLSLPPGTDRCRLRLTSPSAYAWQVQHDGRTHMTIHDPAFAHLPLLYPRAYGFIREGAAEVKVRMEATGEGFHMATLYDPAGQPVATMRHFIDFEDPNRYELELEAPVIGDPAGWSLELYDVKILSIEGMLPWWSDSAEELFNPERASPP